MAELTVAQIDTIIDALVDAAAAEDGMADVMDPVNGRVVYRSPREIAQAIREYRALRKEVANDAAFTRQAIVLVRRRPT